MPTSGDPVDLAALDDDPYPVLARLRADAPVTWAPSLGRWIVTSREHVLELLADTEAFTTDSERSPIRATFGPQMLSTDGHEHRRHRTPFAPSFRARTVRTDYTATIEARCSELVDTLPPGGADLAPLAGELAVLTVIDILGLHAADPDLVRAWYDDFAAALANVTGDAAIAARGLRTAAAFRDLMTDSVTAASEQLDEYAVGSNAMLILFGGIETTESAILNAIWSLLSHRRELDKVRGDGALVPNAVEESLRWEPAVQTLTRYVTRNTKFGGRTIREGDVVEGMIGGANRDPTHFDDPDTFDVTRHNASDHLTFGHGKHTCLGIHLARLEAQIALRTLLERFDDLRLDPERPSRPRGHEFRKVRPLWVRAQPA